jgi:hypothetical protein
MFCNLKKLCQHVEDNLFYLWLKCEAIQTNIIIFIEFVL